MGAALCDEDRIKFDTFVKRQMKKATIDDCKDKPATYSQCPTEKQTLYEYFFDKNQRAWIAYDWITPKYIHDTALKFNEIFVYTADAVQINHILSLMTMVKKKQALNFPSALFFLCIKYSNGKTTFFFWCFQINRPTLLIGDVASAKTATMLNYLKTLNPDSFVSTFSIACCLCTLIHFSLFKNVIFSFSPGFFPLFRNPMLFFLFLIPFKMQRHSFEPKKKKKNSKYVNST